MTTFAFTARDNEGQAQQGLIEADTAARVTAQLRDRGWLVLNVREQINTNASTKSSLAGALMTPRGIQVELSLRQLAVMLRGGISLLAAMQTIATQSDNRQIRSAYNDLIEKVQQGITFSDALESQPGFPNFLIRLVRVGERTGIQETVLVQAADMMHSRRETVREIAAALTYPAIVLVAAGGASLYMITSLIPKLSKLLEGLGKPLPPITQSLVTASNFVEAWGPLALLVLIAIAVSIIITYLSPTGRLAIDRFVLRIPVIGKIFRLSGTLTFSQTLSSLVSSGVTVLDALVTVQQMHANSYLANIVQRSRDSIIRGNNLADTLREKRAYMPLLATMTAVGEQSGNLDEVLEEVTTFHRSQLSGMISTLSAWVTPVIILVVGSIVGYVYIAFFLGMFAIAG
ncbi:type II secretion system F family protein [bacterium]|nr:type II secretion system F family protein [Planctomycetaceae bacterium]MDA7493070.1 type II secretion system F family protein [bacterium]MDB4807608.1 type II secretion system F family protein [bacterium]